ncbi:MAG: M15 family metallopeptidase [Chloroflexi bacterium]|nr:M15 family metallopeptidase [Chloroflexota bacterium]
MSNDRGYLAQPASARVTRWGLYGLTALAILGVLARLGVRTIAIAQEVAAYTATPEPPVAISVTLAPKLTVTRPGPVTATPQPTLPPTPVPPAVQTAVYLEQCSLYSQIPQDLLTRVDRDVELPRDYQPPDLASAPLNARNAYYATILLRQPIHQPLLDMLDAMNQAGLHPWVMSGFRSYSAQAEVFEKWTVEYPDRASQLSAMPGHSEHQLGTAIDFSTPTMNDLYQDYFHKGFAATPEGQWLTRQAAYYGFTLSYPAWAVDVTGYEWEPWHFRYVGILAQQLAERHITLIEYLQICTPHP